MCVCVWTGIYTCNIGARFGCVWVQLYILPRSRECTAKWCCAKQCVFWERTHMYPARHEYNALWGNRKFHPRRPHMPRCTCKSESDLLHIYSILAAKSCSLFSRRRTLHIYRLQRGSAIELSRKLSGAHNTDNFATRLPSPLYYTLSNQLHKIMLLQHTAWAFERSAHLRKFRVDSHLKFHIRMDTLCSHHAFVCAFPLYLYVCVCTICVYSKS